MTETMIRPTVHPPTPTPRLEGRHAPNADDFAYVLRTIDAAAKSRRDRADQVAEAEPLTAARLHYEAAQHDRVGLAVLGLELTARRQMCA